MIVPEGATLVARKLVTGFTPDTLVCLFRGVEAEGVTICHMLLSPADFTAYGNQLTGLRRGIGPIAPKSSPFIALALMGREVFETRGWPQGTMGFVVLTEEAQILTGVRDEQARRIADLERERNQARDDHQRLGRRYAQQGNRITEVVRERDEARAENVRLGKQVERLEADNAQLLTHGLTEALVPRYVRVRVVVNGEDATAEVVPTNVTRIPLSGR